MKIDKYVLGQTGYIGYEEIPYFSEIDKSYAIGDSRLDKFYKYSPTLDQFMKVVRDKTHDSIDRKLLVSVLEKQYSEINKLTPERETTIHSLMASDTYTVITAHQPCLFTGPLYVIYKAISAIKVAKQVNEQYKDFRTIPVFIIGGEDHDFEEMNHTSVYHKSLQWKNKETGPVGRMSTNSIYPILKELQELLGSSEIAEELFQMVQSSYEEHTSFVKATQDLLVKIFKDTDILVVHMDEKRFKERFIPHIISEIFKKPSEAHIHLAQRELNEVGFKEFAHAREINFFYIHELGGSYLRSRIEEKGEEFYIVGTDIQFSKNEMYNEIYEYPERFSPNVVMRPIYQESIFPNLAYIGGGGEIAYWLERGYQFEAFGINFPMLIRRDSLIVINHVDQERLNRLGIPLSLLMQRNDNMVNQYVREFTKNYFSCEQSISRNDDLFRQIVGTAEEIDPTLVTYVNARNIDVHKIFRQIEHKFRQSSKKRNEENITKLHTLKQSLFPHNGLQERVENYLSFAGIYGQLFMDVLINIQNPFDNRVKVISFIKEE